MLGNTSSEESTNQTASLLSSYDSSPSLSVRSGISLNVSLMAGMTWSYMCRTSRQCSENDESFSSSQWRNMRASRNTWTPEPDQVRLRDVWLSLPLVFSHCLCNSTTTVRTSWEVTAENMLNNELYFQVQFNIIKCWYKKYKICNIKKMLVLNYF